MGRTAGPLLVDHGLHTAERRSTCHDAVARSGAARGRSLSERSGTLADDPFRGRRPTSHERLTGLPWDASYHDGPAPWDIGRPQPAIVRLASEGGFAGAVLDAGCGTGENALHVASLGLSVLGVDVAETALARARAKADDRGIEVEFAAADAFQLEGLGRRFETVLDCGLFHTFDGDERPAYVASVASVTEHDGTLYVLCFSDAGPETGPHPVSQGRAESGVQRQHGMERRRHPTGPRSDEIPRRRRRTGLVLDDQTDLDSAHRPSEPLPSSWRSASRPRRGHLWCCRCWLSRAAWRV